MIEPYDVARRLGLDANGRLQRGTDGLSDARRAHPAAHQRGFDPRGTSVSDVQAVSRHFQMSGVGVAGTGPGVRSRRGGTDSEATVGDETMNIYEVSASHREAAIFV